MTRTAAAAYHSRTRDRAPRSLLLRALGEFGDGEGRTVVDLGCGSGADTVGLLERGWTVTAVDKDQSALALLRAGVAASAAGRLSIVHGRFADVTLPPADLVYAAYSLPFCSPEEFTATWGNIRAALRPGGVLAVHLFGSADDWAGSGGMTFHDADEAAALLDGMEVRYLNEKEWDGQAGSSPKHWHVFGIVAGERA